MPLQRRAVTAIAVLCSALASIAAYTLLSEATALRPAEASMVIDVPPLIWPYISAHDVVIPPKREIPVGVIVRAASATADDTR